MITQRHSGIYRFSLRACLGALSALALLAGHAGAEERPNILFIFADDLAYESVGFMGNEEVKTPNLDKLAQNGTVFTHAYNPGAWNGAICMASRAMMMTGKQLWKVHKEGPVPVIKEGKSFPQLLRNEGYDTYYTGKWHVGSNKDCKTAWGQTGHVLPGMLMMHNQKKRYSRNFEPGKDNWSPTDKSWGGFWSKDGKHYSEIVADDAVGKLKEKGDKPFMMMVAFNAPHDPRQAPQKYQDMYPYSKIKVPADFVSENPYNLGVKKIRDELLAPYPRTPYSVQVNRSEYYALITHMDDQIGRILESLEQSGKADNTIIIFSADHGLACGHHGLLGKQNQYDHSVRVPWIITGAGIPKGKKIDSPIYLQDAAATCLDLGGVDKPEHVDFESVMPLVKGDSSKARKLVYNGYVNLQRMVRTDDYKLIVYPRAKQELLFDLKNDPMEMKNLAGDKKYAEVLKDMHAKLAEQMKAMGDPLDLENPDASYKKYLSAKSAH
ncbi:ulvan-active sulfatase [Rubritalea halochordaticola]|uniref:Ulvan-active sulfatase n=1 Tax=Rubritalea halochordaticola TaxID=714537 RepID=A0ABP9V0J2_9BACT